MPGLSDTCFWTDIEQATERLHNSVVLYDDIPAYIVEIIGGFDDGIPRATLYLGPDTQNTTRKRLDSPKFSKFRELPKLGWMNNPERGGAYLLRRLAARTRTHGLSNNNVRVQRLIPEGGGYLEGAEVRFTDISRTKDFLNTHKGVYPGLQEILEVIDKEMSIAFARRYAVARDSDGLRWLYRDDARIGLFTGADTLNLFERFSFYREELMEEANFNINTIQEF